MVCPHPAPTTSPGTPEKQRNRSWADQGRPSLRIPYAIPTPSLRPDMGFGFVFLGGSGAVIFVEAWGWLWLSHSKPALYTVGDNRNHPHACRKITLPDSYFPYAISTPSLRHPYAFATFQWSDVPARQTVMHGGLFNNSYIYIYIYMYIYIYELLNKPPCITVCLVGTSLH